MEAQPTSDPTLLLGGRAVFGNMQPRCLLLDLLPLDLVQLSCPIREFECDTGVHGILGNMKRLLPGRNSCSKGKVS